MNYTANSTYQTNLNLLLSSLATTFTDTNTISRYRYRNITIGRNPNTVYGSLHCREDIAPAICAVCVQIAAERVTQDSGCPSKKTAILFYNGFILRYSDENYFSILNEEPSVVLVFVDNSIANQVGYIDLVTGLPDDLVIEAVTNTSISPSLYATGSANYNTSNQVYAMVQCTPDLAPTLCSKCLRSALGKLPSGAQGASIQLEKQSSCKPRVYYPMEKQSLSKDFLKTQAKEKLLVYELMDASLDHFIFDTVKRMHLDWEKRYKIIGGIAKGLLYLHEDSRLRIIHRDLKASNILLAENMIPKISDFGMARLFKVDQSQANTSRVAGTIGYMAPEYMRHGQFSVKSDVYSFVVLVLEILSGKKITCRYVLATGGAQDLLTYTWRHWHKGTALELLDSSFKDRCSRTEAMKCIHIALLCVQDSIVDRPTMSTVILMLSSNSMTFPLPTQPANFVPDQAVAEETWKDNEASVSELDPR
ncbi:cysteine-rich receptor-like protein kinase 10 [Papaver somniferum]|uniref:cysteine-rich receptor-like protein kinase 10 n=1 Tax=Papaver somniferum TaxID=3469 RepID=UPI000E7027E6|nr:cysteine-rich receptor-like protein kinase 10 [Papaver somniferum]